MISILFVSLRYRNRESYLILPSTCQSKISKNKLTQKHKRIIPKVNISYFWLISFRQKIIWFWISWKLYVWLRVRYMITTKLSPPNSLIMLCWVSLLSVSLFVTIVSNSLKGERKKMQKPKMNLKVHNLINSQSQRPWKLQKIFRCSYPTKS